MAFGMTAFAQNERPDIPNNPSERQIRVLIYDLTEDRGQELAAACHATKLNVSVRVAETHPAFCTLLDQDCFDAVLVCSRAIDSLSDLRAHPVNSQIPALVVARKPCTKTAVEAMRNGAQDYVLREDLSADLLRELLLGAANRMRDAARNWAAPRQSRETETSLYQAVRQALQSEIQSGAIQYSMINAVEALLKRRDMVATGPMQATHAPQLGGRLAHLFEDDGMPQHFEFYEGPKQ
ncbi:MAG: hypothetical protein AAFQ36_07530 [Pseudomonadota bacterium]